MTVQYASDLHLEMPANSSYLRKKPLLPKGDLLILAGDIVWLNNIDQHKDFFDYCSHHFAHTYWIPGNHEYYNTDILKTGGILNEHIRSNVTLVNNTTIDHGGIRIVCSTMWSEIREQEEKIVSRVSDFKRIHYGDGLLNIKQYNQLHYDSLAYIKEAMKAPFDGRKIVVTHYVPTLKYYPNKYIKGGLQEAFAVELQEYIAGFSEGNNGNNIDYPYWIYGHHHKNIPGFKIGNTELLTNQLGYINYKRRNDFNREAIIDIPD